MGEIELASWFIHIPNDRDYGHEREVDDYMPVAHLLLRRGAGRLRAENLGEPLSRFSQ